MSIDSELRFYTLNEVAAILRISRRKLSDLLRRHPIGGRVGRRRLMTAADIAQLYGELQCPSESSNAKAPTTSTSAEPSAASLLMKAQELLKDQRRRPFASNAKKSSSTRRSSGRR
ncbi:MAG: helix-turn-helix domain-containing protein [Alphaproteobacteria bacterium]|nr:helix-turn-helix domain-containing protein [Alphaproteobacteria bacterium]